QRLGFLLRLEARDLKLVASLRSGWGERGALGHFGRVGGEGRQRILGLGGDGRRAEQIAHRQRNYRQTVRGGGRPGRLGGARLGHEATALVLYRGERGGRFLRVAQDGGELELAAVDAFYGSLVASARNQRRQRIHLRDRRRTVTTVRDEGRRHDRSRGEGSEHERPQTRGARRIVHFLDLFEVT